MLTFSIGLEKFAGCIFHPLGQDLKGKGHMEVPPLISVLTPSWNRAAFLETVYQSLEAQSFKEFEWIIIDDGSTDETQCVVKEILNRSKFAITFGRYSKQVGKCRADNKLLDLARGKYIIWCDSDDILLPNALSKMNELWTDFNERDYIATIGMCSDTEGNIQSTKVLEEEFLECKWIDLKEKYNMTGDMCIMFDRALIGSERFPEHDLVMNESGFWYKFMNMDVLVTSEILKEMNRDCDNRISGSKKMEYCRGKAYSIAYADMPKYHSYSFLKKLSVACRFHRYSSHGDIQWAERKEIFGDAFNAIYYLALIPAGIHVLRDKFSKDIVKSHLRFEDGKSAVFTLENNY